MNPTPVLPAMKQKAAPPDRRNNRVRTCLAAIAEAHTIAITSHAKPDGDAVGSCLALRRLLAQAGKAVHVAGLAPLPGRYEYLAEVGEIETAAEVLSVHKPDLLIALDASSIDRIPEEFRAVRGVLPILNVDHHADNTRYGDLNLVDNAASSTGEVVYRLATAAGYPLNRDIAARLWIAIVTDTGRFTHENTTPRAMRTAAELLTFGLPTEEIDRRLYRSLKPAELELQKRVLQSLELHANGQVAFASLGRPDFAAAGCGPEEVNELVEIPRSVAGVNVAALFYTNDDRSGIKVSMRSNAPYDIGAVCRELGGGGHPRAAGCTLPMDLDGARRVLLDKLVTKWFPPANGGKQTP